MGDWDELVAGAEYVPAVVLPQMESVVERAIAAGAKPPLEYIGAGMTSVVFCVGKVAYKVARRADDIFLSEEAEWLETAKTVPWVRDRVAKIHHFDPDSIVIVRECPMPGPDMTPYRFGEGKLFDLHQEIRKRMIPHGWTAPEFKPDSYVITKDGPVLVDASMPARVGKRFLDYVRDVMDGRREPAQYELPDILASTIRMEIGEGRISQADAEEVLARLAELEASGNKWKVGEMMMNEARSSWGDLESKIRNMGGRIRFSDRFKKMNPDDGPRWTAFVSVFGYDLAGEGSTKSEAISRALDGLPSNISKHFYNSEMRDGPVLDRKEKTKAGNASEMVVVARLADHYEKDNIDNALATAEHDFLKLQREAPTVWQHLLYESKMSEREIGDWIYEFIVQWSKSGKSFKNFAADWADDNLRGDGRMRDGPALDRKKIAIDVSRSQQAAARAEIAAARQEAANARAACSAARQQAANVCAGAKTMRQKRDALVRLAHEYRLIRRAELARKPRRQGPGVQRAESDDEVVQNIPPELVPTWEKMKRSIGRSDRKSRTEAFLEWVEAHPSEIVWVEPSDEDYERSYAQRRVGEMREATLTEQQIVDYFIFNADDADVGYFSRASTDEIAKHFKIDPKAAYDALNAFHESTANIPPGEPGRLSKSRDVVKGRGGKKAFGYQLWEYYWRPGDLERFDRGR